MSDELTVRSCIGGSDIDGGGDEVVNEQPSAPAVTASRFRYVTADELRTAVDAGDAARAAWRTRPAHERADILLRAAALLEDRVDLIARDIAQEQGKVLEVSRGEVRRAAAIFAYFANEANRATGSMYASPRRGERIFTDRVPVGQVLCITPWNVPLAIPAWKIAPALVHGNTVLWKPSQVTPLIARRLFDVLTEAGLPAGVLNLALARGSEVEELLADPRISACTFTGSTAVGKHLVARGARHGVDVLAEMGGKNAAIVLADADLDWAADQIVSASMGWSGQRCTATSRVIVERPILDEFLQLFTRKVEALAVGDPLAPEMELGPVSSLDQYRSIRDLLVKGQLQGAKPVVGGLPPEDPSAGYFIDPTVVIGATEENVLFTEEIFGPVAVVLPADGPKEALRLANHGKYGLSGSLYTENLGVVLDLIDEFDVGVLHVNSESTGADPHVPFGGWGESGTSHREMGEEARNFYTSQRTIYLRGGRP